MTNPRRRYAACNSLAGGFASRGACGAGDNGRAEMNDVLIQRIDDLMNRGDLTTWEIDFLESVQVAVRAGKELTEKQGDVLDTLEERHA